MSNQGKDKLTTYEVVDNYYKITGYPRSLNSFTYTTNEVNKCLSSGISLQQIMDNINNNKSLYKQEEKQQNKSTNGHNLIIDGTFYYHPFLRVPVPAPLAVQDEVTGEIETIYHNNEDMKLSITLDDILEYTYESFGITDSSCNIKRDLGALKHVLNSNVAEAVRIAKDKRVNGLDLLLFTIDTARWNIYDNDLKVNNILQIVDYVGEAMEIYKEKITQYSYLNA